MKNTWPSFPFSFSIFDGGHKGPANAGHRRERDERKAVEVKWIPYEKFFFLYVWPIINLLWKRPNIYKERIEFFLQESHLLHLLAHHLLVFYYSSNNKRENEHKMNDAKEEDARKCCPKVALQLSFIVAASWWLVKSRHKKARDDRTIISCYNFSYRSLSLHYLGDLPKHFPVN